MSEVDAATADIAAVVLSSLTEKNRQKVVDAGAEDCVEKNSLMPLPGAEVLPKIVENMICRINRRRRIAFGSIPADKQAGRSAIG